MKRQVTGKFNFTVRRNLTNTILSIDYYEVGAYPLTYSIMDCLEHFCDGAGWELDSLRYGYEGLNSTDGSTIVKRPFKTRSFGCVFVRAETLYRNRRGRSPW